MDITMVINFMMGIASLIMAWIAHYFIGMYDGRSRTKVRMHQLKTAATIIITCSMITCIIAWLRGQAPSQEMVYQYMWGMVTAVALLITCIYGINKGMIKRAIRHSMVIGKKYQHKRGNGRNRRRTIQSYGTRITV